MYIFFVEKVYEPLKTHYKMRAYSPSLAGDLGGEITMNSCELTLRIPPWVWTCDIPYIPMPPMVLFAKFNENQILVFSIFRCQIHLRTGHGGLSAEVSEDFGLQSAAEWSCPPCRFGGPSHLVMVSKSPGVLPCITGIKTPLPNQL